MMTTYLFEFMLQFLLAEFVFAKGMPRRKHFAKRIVGFGILLAGIMYGLTCLQLVFPFWQYYIYYLFVMLPLAFVYAWLCFDVRVFSALYISFRAATASSTSAPTCTVWCTTSFSTACRVASAADTGCGSCPPMSTMC